MIKKLASGYSMGKILKSRDTAGFTMNEIAYPAKSRLSKHFHENAHYCFVLRGSYTEFHNEQEMFCNPSSLTFRIPGDVHEDKFHNQDVRVFTMEIPFKWMERLQQGSIYLSRSIYFQDGIVMRHFKRLVKEFHQMDTAAGLIIEGLALEIMAETARQSASNIERTIPYWLKQAKDLIHCRFTENLALEQIASEAGVHPVHLASVFRQKYYCTVGEYIRELRIEYACREITKGEKSLATIALEAGFANQGHFSVNFKRLTGFTPTSYRNSFRQS